jgi:phage-related protein
MYGIIFYKDKDGKSPTSDYIKGLSKNADKGSRIKAKKINDYIQALSLYGKRAGEPYIKHLDGEIWEIRPLRDRILFAAWYEGGFIILHHFMKQTQKTPIREIEQAKRNLNDYIKRSGK